MKTNETRPARAFTLIELLAVIAIIALLMGILIPSVNLARNQAKKSKTATLISSLTKACEIFNSDNGRYPKSGGDNPFESGSNVPLSGAQWLALKLVGADQLGYVKPVISNDSNTGRRGVIDQDDWLDWYSLEPDRKYPRLGPYMVPNGDLLQSPAAYAKKHPAAAPLPNSLKNGSSDWNNERVPFFVDALGFPVIYYRANPSAQFAITSATASDVGVFTQADNAAFTGSSIGLSENGWDFAGVGKPHSMMELGYNSSNPLDRPENDTFAHAIFNRSIFDTTKRDENTGRVWPYNDKTYLIISPGLDGLFGTGDDIKNFDTGG